MGKEESESDMDERVDHICDGAGWSQKQAFEKKASLRESK